MTRQYYALADKERTVQAYEEQFNVKSKELQIQRDKINEKDMRIALQARSI